MAAIATPTSSAEAQFDCDGLSYNELIAKGCDVPSGGSSPTDGDAVAPLNDGKSTDGSDSDATSPSDTLPFAVVVAGLTAGGGLLHVGARRIRTAPLSEILD